MKKRLIWLLGLGLTLIIVPFIINVYSIFRLISLIIGIILIMISFCLKKKRSIFLIILVPLIILVVSLGLDTLLVYKLRYVPIFSLQVKSNKDVKTYNSLFYRVYDCKKDLILDYGYNKNYACSNDLLETISVNKFLQDSKASFKEYKNKFVRINGKVSKISGNEVIEMAEYTKSDDVLNGYVNFNLSNSLKVLTKDDLSKYRIYDYIDVIGRVSEYQNGVIELMDVVLIPSGLYDSYSFEIINNNDNKLSNLVKEKDYYYYKISSINIKYDQDNIYELSYVLIDERIKYEDLVKNVEFESIKDKEDKEIAKKYSLEKFNILKCSNNKKIFVNKSVNVNSNICDMELE